MCPYMTEEILREIIGLAPKSKWNKVKQFIVEIVKKTLKNSEGYTLVALDAQIKDKQEPELSLSITTTDELKNINQIKSFSNLSLYQYTQDFSNHINLTQSNGTIVLIAKFMGPEINHNDYFDFAIYIDPIEEPHFTTGTGQTLSCSELLKIFKKEKKIETNRIKSIKTGTKQIKPKKREKKKTDTKKSKPKTPRKKPIKKAKSKPKKEKVTITKVKNTINKGYTKPKQITETKPEDMEASIYEKIKGKNAIWAGAETKTYQVWKNISAKKYRKETGKNPYYKGVPTQGYIKYLEKLSRLQKKNTKDKKSVAKKKKNSI
jgi:hypothetical protein